MKKYNLRKYLVASFGVMASVWLAVFSLGYSTGVDAAIADCTTVVGNLITNCSFEDPIVVPAPMTAISAANQHSVNTSYNGITGWTAIPGSSGGNLGTITNDGALVAASGQRLIDISGHTNTSPSYVEATGSGIQQTISGLTPGQTYEIKFSLGYPPLQALFGVTSARATVLIDGVPSVEGLSGFTVTNTTPGTTDLGLIKWKEQRTTFVATSTTATIMFRNEFTQPGRVDFIDNVVVELVPDITPPTLTLSPATTTISAPFTVTVCTSEPLATIPAASTLELSDFNVTNGTASGLSGPTTGPSCLGGEIYTVTITPTIVVDGTITVSIPSGATTDPSGNPSTTVNSVNATYDIITVVISPVHIQTNNGTNNQYGTTGNTVTLTYTTDIDITTAGTHTVTIGGQSVIPSCVGAGPSTCIATLPITAIVPISDGLVPFTIIVDNQTTTATTDGSFVIVDRVINVVITTPVVGDDLSTFSIGGSCEIGAGNVTISGTGFSPSPVTTPCNGLGNFQYGPVTGIPGAITITATQTDLAGNVGTANALYVFDATAPTITLSTPSTTVSGPFVLTITPSETLTGFTIGDITISDPLVNTLSGFIGPDVSGNYHVTVNPGSSGITISVAAGVATDAVGNPNTISNTLAIAYSTAVIPPSGGTGGGVVLIDLCNNINDAQFSIPFGMYRQDGNCHSLITQDPQNPPISVPPTINPNTTLSDHCEPYLTKDIILNSVFNDSDEVKKLEQFLNSSEGENLVVNGIYEQVDFEAVKRFQEKYSKDIVAPWAGVAPTGVVGSYTRGKINVMTCAKNTNCPYFNEYHKQGDVGGQVSKIQNFLNILMGEKLQENGIFDRLTFGAVMRYQSRYHVTVLSPWNMKAPSGWWYQSSRFVANDLANCSEVQKTLDNGVTITSKKY